MLNKDLFGADVKDAHGSALAETWEYPPFSALNARDGWWQERKRAWLSLGIKSELGRGGGGDRMTNASNRAMQLAGGFKARHGLAD